MGGMKNKERRSRDQEPGPQPHPGRRDPGKGRDPGRGGVRREKAGLGT